MLNISENRLSGEGLSNYRSFELVTKLNTTRKLAYWVIAFFVIGILMLMLPWTQNIGAKGKLTTILPEHRPQSVYSIISGRIERWYVREGESVHAGDTIAFISEVKSEYLDPRLLERTQNQLSAKNASRSAYDSKTQALADQLIAMDEAMRLKLEQTRNKLEQYRLKIISDSMSVEASKVAYGIAKFQYLRTDTLYQKGIKSLTDLELKRNKMQESESKLVAYENKLLSTRNDLLNTRIELNGIQSLYADKMAKVRSERSSALSSIYDAESQIAKLESQYSNYEKRNNMYYIIAPQDGYVIKILKKGLGEMVKEGEALLTLMPAVHDLAVESYISPMDYPLLLKGQKVRFIFDGWPALVFSGWPESSYGTFGGKILAIDNIANENGKFRILIAPDEDEKPWPTSLRVGTGASGMIMLNDVPLWYEFWRQLNGFPPEFYKKETDEKYKLKAPANHLKK